jgi:uncharacterized protein (TIGR02594 family)
MTPSSIAYDIASAQQGTFEWKEGSNPEVLKYFAESGHAEIGDDATPWCAAFVGSVLARAGLPNTGSLLARSYTNWGSAVDIAAAQKGDVIVLQRGNSTWQGHVGFYDSHTDDGVMVLGGNQNDAVNIRGYDRGRLLAVRRAKQPRKSLAQSKTIGASQVAKVAAAATPVVSAASGMDWQNLLIVAGLALVVLVATGVIDLERIKKWRAGQK